MAVLGYIGYLVLLRPTQVERGYACPLIIDCRDASGTRTEAVTQPGDPLPAWRSYKIDASFRSRLRPRLLGSL